MIRIRARLCGFANDSYQGTPSGMPKQSRSECGLSRELFGAAVAAAKAAHQSRASGIAEAMP
jgi:hypothetical protein